jgi:hypothetical protein
MRKYKISYRIEPGEFTKEYLITNGLGGCDQVILCSYLELEDGGGSYAWVDSGMTWGRQMHCWMNLTKKLAETAPLDCQNQKQILEHIFEVFRQAIIKSNPK